MISPETKGPAAGTTANRTSKEALLKTENLPKEHSIDADDFQCLIVASRYNLEPHIARLICDLAGIGAVR
jgi:hypothetical protein